MKPPPYGFYLGTFDRLVATLVHNALVQPYVWLTGRPTICLARLLWFLAWVALGIYMANRLDEILNLGNATLTAILIPLGAANVYIVSVLQRLFLVQARDFCLELTRCARELNGRISPELRSLVNQNALLRQLWLVVGTADFLVFRSGSSTIAVWYLLALQRYALTDIQPGSGKWVLGRAFDRLRKIEVRVPSSPGLRPA